VVGNASSEWEGVEVVSAEFLQIVEGLHHLDPVRTYPARAARLVADLAGAGSYRVELEESDAGRQRQLDSTPPPPIEGSALSLPLRHGRQQMGTLHLYMPAGSEHPDGAQLRLVRWGARALARGLSYAHRMSNGRIAPLRDSDDVASRLERTPLTRREREVVASLVRGASTRAIAEQTGLTVATVHTYLKRIYAKLGVHSRVELVARMLGTVRPNNPPAAVA
jgi:DNA-binding CsgD family transcriptional regulator